MRARHRGRMPHGPRHPARAPALIAADPVMAELIRRVGPCRLGASRGADPFFPLLRAIVRSRCRPRPPRTIFAGCARCSRATAPTPSRLLALDPRPRCAAPASSPTKTRYVRDLAARVRDGRLDLAALDATDDDAALRALTAVHGIGTWTAEMFLHLPAAAARRLPRRRPRPAHRDPAALPDAQPAHADAGAQVAERWRPHRSVAAGICGGAWSRGWGWAGTAAVGRPVTHARRATALTLGPVLAQSQPYLIVAVSVTRGANHRFAGGDRRRRRRGGHRVGRHPHHRLFDRPADDARLPRFARRATTVAPAPSAAAVGPGARIGHGARDRLALELGARCFRSKRTPCTEVPPAPIASSSSSPTRVTSSTRTSMTLRARKPRGTCLPLT